MKKYEELIHPSLAASVQNQLAARKAVQETLDHQEAEEAAENVRSTKLNATVLSSQRVQDALALYRQEYPSEAATSMSRYVWHQVYGPLMDKQFRDEDYPVSHRSKTFDLASGHTVAFCPPDRDYTTLEELNPGYLIFTSEAGGEVKLPFDETFIEQPGDPNEVAPYGKNVLRALITTRRYSDRVANLTERNRVWGPFWEEIAGQHEVPEPSVTLPIDVTEH